MADGVELATAYISIVPEGSKIAPEVKRQFGKVGVEADRAGKTTGKRFGSAFGSGLKLLGAAALGGGAISFLKDANAEAREAQKVGARTANVIKTTGGAAKVSAKQVGDLSTAISNKTGIDDEAIQSGANLLLTFKNIRNEAGKGNKIFDRTTQAAADLSASGFGDLSGASKQLGKALNDPIKGITALSKSGVTFTDQQKKQIKTLVESGKTLKAQKIILKEVESQVGGAAAAQATAGDKAAVAIGNLKEQIGTALLPVVDDLANRVAKDVVPAVSDFITGMQEGTGAGGDFVDVAKDIGSALGDVVDVGKDVLGFFDGLPGPLKKVGVETLIAYVALNKITKIVGPAATAFGAWTSSLKTSATNLDTVAAKSKKFGAGLQTLVGAGGLVALQDGLGRSESGLGKLESALGGAALGFAATGGNPLGALVGGLGGLYVAAFKAGNATERAGEKAAISAGAWQDYASTLDDVTGSTTAATRAMAKQRLDGSKLLGLTRELGISDRQVINATVQGGKARQGVVRTLNQERAAIDASLASRTSAINAEVNAGKLGVAFGQQQIRTAKEEAAARRERVDAVLEELDATPKAIAARRLDIAATKDYGKALDALPDKKQTKVEALGIVPTERGIARLAEKINATPEEIKTLISASGVKTTVAEIQRVINKLHEASQIRATATIVLNTIGGLFGQRERGGPVTKGQPYIVGEKRPELFVPNQSGRIVPRVPAASQSGSAAPFSGPINITLDGRTFRGYMETVADSRVNSAAALRGETDRGL